jgi:hypothetical protein
LGQVQWNMPAILVPPGNMANVSGSLAFCVRYWRDKLGPVQQITAMIAMAGGRWIEPEELLRISVDLPDGEEWFGQRTN